MKLFLPAFVVLFLIVMPVLAQEEPPAAESAQGAASQAPDTAANAPPPMRSYMGATKPQQAPEKTFEREPNVEIWLPPEFQSTEKKWPLLIFSHGFGGCAKQSAFLMKYLADHGYIVIAPDHADARCNRGSAGNGGLVRSMRAGTRDWPEKPFRNPESWTDKTEADRKDDILFALSSMLDDRQYKNYIDLKRIGLIGHSLGGYTALGLAGAWPSWKDKRFKAVLALSPYVAPYLQNGGLKKVHVPVMYQGGSLDKDITPQLKGRRGAYAQSHAPKYYVELDGANHFAWTELQDKYETIVGKTALQFFDRYVKGGNVAILPEGQDRPGRPVNKVKSFEKDEGAQGAADEGPKN